MKDLINKFLLISFSIMLFSCDRITDDNSFDDGLPPAVPANLHVYAAYDGKIIIEWDKGYEPDVKEYIIYRSIEDSLSFSKLSSTDLTYYVDDSLSYNTTYFYKIAALDYSGRKSEFSSFVKAKPINLLPPDEIRYLKAYGRNLNGSMSVLIEWEKASESDLKHYLIFRGESENFMADSSSLTALSNKNYFTDTKSFQLNKYYYYKIIPQDQGGLVASKFAETRTRILDTPKGIFPSQNSEVGYFQNFKFVAVKNAVYYKIILKQYDSNEEIWNYTSANNAAGDTLTVRFNSFMLKPNRAYNWHVVVYDEDIKEPNSISETYSFIIREN